MARDSFTSSSKKTGTLGKSLPLCADLPFFLDFTDVIDILGCVCRALPKPLEYTYNYK
jgi:hypothetical protein